MINQTEPIFVRSPFVQTVFHEELRMAAVWHSLFGMMKILPTETVAILDKFLTPHSLNEVLSVNMDDNIAKTTRQLIDSRFLIIHGFDERVFLSQCMQEREIDITRGSLIGCLALIVSEECNFRCKPCIHFKNLEITKRIGQKSKLMSFDVAKKAVDDYLCILRKNNKKETKISFSGGEPLLGWGLIEQMLEYCVSEYGNEFSFQFCITTNGSLITPHIASVLKKYQVELSSSLDGCREGNDRVRLTRTHEGTFDSIISGLKNLEVIDYPVKLIGVTISESNFAYIDESIVDLVATLGVFKMHIDLDMISMVAISIDEAIKKIMHIRQYARTQGIEVTGYWTHAMENLSKSTIGSQLVSFCDATQGRSLCVSPSGKIYGCGYSNLQIGSIADMKTISASEREYHKFVRLTGRMELCKGCMIEGQCGGGCAITQEFTQVTNSAKIDFMCKFYRRATHELILESLKTASQQR